MSRMNHLLAATDFSGPSRHACERAARLARAAGAPLRLVHVVSDSALARLQQILGRDDPVEQAVVDDTRRALEALAAELRSTRGAEVEARLLFGSMPQTIVEQADEIDADLLVLGARGAGFMRRLLLGSTAERMLRQTLRPLLVVRQRANESYRRVLVPVDFSPWSAQLPRLARRIAPAAHLVLMHAYEIPFEEKLGFAGVDSATVERYRAQAEKTATHQLHALVADVGLAADEWTPRIVRGDASLSIVMQEQDSDCDLIVIGKHGQHMAQELLLGSVTRHVLAESAGDVLISTLTNG